MRRCKAIIAFDGSAYCGFQRQPKCQTVEGELNTALSQLFREDIRVTGSSRTDSGVHAGGMVLHFDTNNASFPLEKLPLAIEAFLPTDIAIIAAEEVDDSFHARYSVVDKTYDYLVYTGTDRAVFYRKRAYIYKYDLNLDLMRAAAAALLGEHDFRAFMASGSSATTTTRRISALDISKTNGLIRISVTADGFLYNMVRIIVGTLLDIGRGFLNSDTIERMLTSGKRELGGHTAVADGLYLSNVRY